MATTEMDKTWINLGKSKIQQKENRAKLPDLVFDLELFSSNRGEFAHWGFRSLNRTHKSDTNYVMISDSNEYFNGAKYIYVDSVRVRENRVITVPKAFFSDYGDDRWERPVRKQLRFEYGQEIYFLTNGKLLNNDGKTLYVIPSEKILDFKEMI